MLCLHGVRTPRFVWPIFTRPRHALDLDRGAAPRTARMQASGPDRSPTWPIISLSVPSSRPSGAVKRSGVSAFTQAPTQSHSLTHTRTRAHPTTHPPTQTTHRQAHRQRARMPAVHSRRLGLSASLLLLGASMLLLDGQAGVAAQAVVCDGTATLIQAGMEGITSATFNDRTPLALGGPNRIRNGDFSFNITLVLVCVYVRVAPPMPHAAFAATGRSPSTHLAPQFWRPGTSKPPIHFHTPTPISACSFLQGPGHE